MYKALSVRCERCTKKKTNKKNITLRCMVIGTRAVQFLHYIPLYRNTQHYATLNCSVKTILHNSRLCTKGGMVAIVTSAKCTHLSVTRAVFTRVTSSPRHSRYTRRFVSKLVEKASRGQSSFGRYEYFADSVAEAQLTACRSTRKHAMRLFSPVWTQ